MGAPEAPKMAGQTLFAGRGSRTGVCPDPSPQPPVRIFTPSLHFGFRGHWRQVVAYQGWQPLSCVPLCVLPALVGLGICGDPPSPLAYPFLHSGKGVGDFSME